MALEPARHHTRVDVAAETQLEPDTALGDFPLHVFAEVDHVAQPARRPRQDLGELRRVAGALCLAKVDRDAEAEGPGFGEGGAKDGDGFRVVVVLARGVDAGGRVAAEIYADDAPVAEGGCEADCFVGLGWGVAAVDGEDEAGAHGVWVIPVRCFESVYRGEDGGNVDGRRFGGRRGEGARGGAEFEVGYAVCVEVLQDGECCFAKGVDVGDEVVNVG